MYRVKPTMLWSTSWILFFLVIQTTPGVVFQCLAKVKRWAMRINHLDKKKPSNILCVATQVHHFYSGEVDIHWSYFSLTIKRKLNGCGVTISSRTEWKNVGSWRVFKMTELDARVEIEAFQRPWRAIINTRGITTGLTEHVICSFHRPVVDSLSDAYDSSPVWSTSSVPRAVLLGLLNYSILLHCNLITSLIQKQSI